MGFDLLVRIMLITKHQRAEIMIHEKGWHRLETTMREFRDRRMGLGVLRTVLWSSARHLR